MGVPHAGVPAEGFGRSCRIRYHANISLSSAVEYKTVVVPAGPLAAVSIVAMDSGRAELGLGARPLDEVLIVQPD